MNRRLFTVLVCAFSIAALCFVLVLRIIGRHAPAGHQMNSSRIVAAAGDIKLGTLLKASDLTTIEVSGALPKGAILKPENAVGRGVVSDLYQGEPILESRLAPAGSGGGLAATIRPGMRACAVKVDEVVGVAGFVVPGMRVDVLVSGDAPGPQNATEGMQVKTLLQNIEVLSAGTDFQKDSQGKPQQVHVVNLLVNPEQAELLSLASNQTHIQLVLRNPLDTQVAQVTGTAMASLFGVPKAAPVKAPQPEPVKHPAVREPATPGYSVEVWNGAQRTEQKFSSPEVRQ